MRMAYYEKQILYESERKKKNVTQSSSSSDIMKLNHRWNIWVVFQDSRRGLRLAATSIIKSGIQIQLNSTR